MARVILFLAIFPSLIGADHLAVPDHNLEHLKCDLDCRNNGVCRFFTRERQGLQEHMQSGKMVQQCICPLGFHGMACDVNVNEHPQCTSSTTNSTKSTNCDCTVAERISTFAGEQCRNPFTEYCASLQNSVGQHISYCTHGGKCRGDVFAARIEPGNTSSNYVFQHTGCLCPPEFIGEHCELLNKDGIFHPKYHLQAPTLSATTNTGHKQNAMGTFAVVVICVGAMLVITAGMLLKSRIRNPLRRHGIPPRELALRRYRDINLAHGDDSDDDESASKRDKVLPPLA